MKYLSEIAGAIGKTADSVELQGQYQKGQAVYHNRFWNATKCAYSPCVNSSKSHSPTPPPSPSHRKRSCHNTSAFGSQTPNALALALGAPPDAATAKRVAAHLANGVVAFGNRSTSGVTGISFVLPMLGRYGYGDLALAVLLNDAYPSIGHMAHQNMTTLCENHAFTFHHPRTTLCYLTPGSSRLSAASRRR